jgi:hypothetical protein
MPDVLTSLLKKIVNSVIWVFVICFTFKYNKNLAQNGHKMFVLLTITRQCRKKDITLLKKRF